MEWLSEIRKLRENVPVGIRCRAFVREDWR